MWMIKIKVQGKSTNICLLLCCNVFLITECVWIRSTTSDYNLCSQNVLHPQHFIWSHIFITVNFASIPELLSSAVRNIKKQRGCVIVQTGLLFLSMGTNCFKTPQVIHFFRATNEAIFLKKKNFFLFLKQLKIFFKIHTFLTAVFRAGVMNILSWTHTSQVCVWSLICFNKLVNSCKYALYFKPWLHKGAVYENSSHFSLASLSFNLQILSVSVLDVLAKWSCRSGHRRWIMSWFLTECEMLKLI